MENARKLALSIGYFDFDEGMLSFHRGVISNPYLMKVFVDPQVRIITSIDSKEFCLDNTRGNIPLIICGKDGKIESMPGFDFSEVDRHIQVVLATSPEIKK